MPSLMRRFGETRLLKRTRLPVRLRTGYRLYSPNEMRKHFRLSASVMKRRKRYAKFFCERNMHCPTNVRQAKLG